MAIGLQDVIRQLDRDEPNYAQAARLGPEALPFLRELIQGENIGIATKAAYLAGVINGDQSTEVLEAASRHANPAVRVAAAASARNLTRLSPSLASNFLDDPDPGVRKWVLKTLEAHHPEGVKAKVERIMRQDPVMELRERASSIVDRLP